MNNDSRIVDNLGSGDKNALFIYLTEPFFSSPKDKETDTRFRSARTIVNILNDYGYSVDTVRYDDSGYGLDIDKYDLIFGQGELFEKLAEKEDIYSIYYATGRYKAHIDEQLKIRQDKLKERKDKSIPLLRTGLGFNEGAKYADGVLALGSGCAETYKQTSDNVEHVLFEPSTYIKHDLENKDFDQFRDKFLFFSGPGPLLKGLDLALDSFSQLPNYNLYIAGPQISIDNYTNNKKFIDLYRDILTKDNIYNIRWLEKTSDEFDIVTNNCNFVLSLSLSEGTNMSTLACMRRGIIPIVTKYSLEIDISDDLVIKVPDDVDEISNVISQLTHMREEKYKEMSYGVAEWARENLSWDKAERQLDNKIGKLL